MRAASGEVRSNAALSSSYGRMHLHWLKLNVPPCCLQAMIILGLGLHGTSFWAATRLRADRFGSARAKAPTRATVKIFFISFLLLIVVADSDTTRRGLEHRQSVHNPEAAKNEPSSNPAQRAGCKKPNLLRIQVETLPTHSPSVSRPDRSSTGFIGRDSLGIRPNIAARMSCKSCSRRSWFRRIAEIVQGIVCSTFRIASSSWRRVVRATTRQAQLSSTHDRAESLVLS